jgi:Spy/CpxP family protein refolding chaperone
LSDEQVRAIEDKQFEYKRKKIALYAEHRIQHMDLDKLVHSGGLNESAIREVGERMKKTKMEKIQLMIDSKITLLKILTDEQRKKIRDMHHGG